MTDLLFADRPFRMTRTAQPEAESHPVRGEVLGIDAVVEVAAERYWAGVADGLREAGDLIRGSSPEAVWLRQRIYAALSDRVYGGRDRR